uniref:Uncharacterized protein n=1 Tax=Micrurus carvalhoi TaxID=3147026 RepID=A0A2H6NI70_9SAUR
MSLGGLSMENLLQFKPVLREYKQQALEKNQSFGEIFQLVEALIWMREQKMAEAEEQREEGAIFRKAPKTLRVVSIKKKKERIKKSRFDILLKKKSTLQRKKNMGKNQRRGPQTGRLDKRRNKGEKEEKGVRELIDQN